MFLKARAKINLSLDVIRRRADGYHEVRMVMQTVGMYDGLHLTPERGRQGVRLTTNLPYIPTDDSNLVVKAAKLVMEEKGVTDGLAVQLDKFIPVAAGLAGGSSDAAMTLLGVNELFRLGFTKEELMLRAKKIGADVPYCIMGGTALSEGIGEILTPLPDMPACHILLCKPSISVSTKEIYTALHLDETTVHPDVDGQIRALKDGDLRGMVTEERMYNVLESVTAPMHPVIREIEKEMKDGGAIRAIMSGSGPTVFGIFEDYKAAEKVRDHLRATRANYRTFLTAPENPKTCREFCCESNSEPV